ncbi:MAG: winged helix-turn-helix domain-containing protein [Acidobacteria bacterium]|nr:winged helix-turn-helix domain-containing protein [Acidobacteriota bacterium]
MQVTEKKGDAGRRRVVYRCLDIEIDTGAPAVSRNGQDLELRAKALLVLLFLLDNRDRIVNKEEIFEKVWPGVTVVDATLAGCIQEIRKALADDAKDPKFIKTIPRLGYRFVAPVREPEAPATQSDQTTPPKSGVPRWLWLVAGTVLVALAAAALVGRKPALPAEIYEEAVWWKLDEGAGATFSDTRQGLNGTIAGGASWDRGLSGSGLRFNGSGRHIEGIDLHGVLPRGSMARSLALWVKVESASADIAGLLHFGEPLGPQVYDATHLALLPDGRPVFANQGYAGIGEDRSLALGNRSIVDGAWHHLLATMSGDRGVLYVDGEQQAIVRIHAATGAASHPARWAIGNHIGQTHNGFRGWLDDVRIWRREVRASEAAALHRCATQGVDMTAPDGQVFFFSPIFNWDPAAEGPRVGLRENTLIHRGLDYGGIQLVKAGKGCGVLDLRGADAGQDLRISVDLLVPSPKGQILQAGPYFRSRGAAPGDGILGGTSAGYWVQLHSDGKVTVKCLNPVHTVAFSEAITGFDSNVFHRLEATVRGDRLEATLDGNAVKFRQDGAHATAVRVLPHWETPKKTGRNHGTTGIAFSAEPLRPKAGGQQARNFRILPVTP